MQVPYVDLVKQHKSMRAELLEAVGRVLDHGNFILGPELTELERRLADFLGVTDVVGVASGTDALILALRLRGIGSGDEVITVSHSFIATASAIRLVGATPAFVDIDEDTMLMDPQLLDKAVTSHTKAVIPVHLNGLPCDMEPIVDFCRKHDLVLIEDCAQALGARYRGKMVGSFGIGAFSLHPLKILSACGDAGFISVGNMEDAIRLRQLRNLGLRDRDHCVYTSSNSRLDTLHAAILLVKLKYLRPWIDKRRRRAMAYREALKESVVLPPTCPDRESINSSFVIRHPKRDRLLESLIKRGVEAKIHYPIPIHQQEAFASSIIRSLPVTEKVAAEILSLPISPDISESAAEQVIQAIKEGLQEISYG